jgi:hypothetical protein
MMLLPQKHDQTALHQPVSATLFAAQNATRLVRLQIKSVAGEPEENLKMSVFFYALPEDAQYLDLTDVYLSLVG